MALKGLSTTTEFFPTIRFNAREGIFSRADRVLGTDGDFRTELVPINEALATDGILIDVANIGIGWIRFEGMVDIVTQHHSLGLPGPQPTSLHKEGVRLELWLPTGVAEGAQVREWTHTAAGVKNAVNDLHTVWEGGTEGLGDEERNKGAVIPHVRVGTEDFRTKNGTFAKPTFEIVGWVERPDEWPVPAIVPATRVPVPVSEPSAPGATKGGLLLQKIEDLPF